MDDLNAILATLTHGQLADVLTYAKTLLKEQEAATADPKESARTLPADAGAPG